MAEYTPITLNQGLNDVTYIDDGRITDVKWDVPIYFLRSNNNYENIGSINEIRRRQNFDHITDANRVPIGTIDELRTNRLFIRNYEEKNEEEKRTPPKIRGGKTKARKSRKSSNKKRKQRKTKRTKK